MAVHFQFKNIDATDALKSHIEKRVEKFEKFVSYSMEIHIFLKLEREQHIAELKCHAEHKEMVATAKEEDLYAAIDMVCHKIEAQLKKEREKRKGHSTAHRALEADPEALPIDIMAEVPHLGKRTKS